MKIISKYKDYYDYLQGIYGVDEKLVLDRREHCLTSHPIDNSIIRLFICGLLVEGYYLGECYYYGEDIEQFHDSGKYYTSDAWNKTHYSIPVSNGKYREFLHVLKDPMKMPDNSHNPNIRENCPIMVQVFGTGKRWRHNEGLVKEFPILKDYNISKVFSPEDMWIMLSEWLAKEKTILDNRTNKEKILSHGFDYVESFRNIK